jgi:hypothetical protein
MVDEGGSLVIDAEDRFIGPGQASVYRHGDSRFAFAFRFYDRHERGRARLEVRNLVWVDDWPVVAQTDFFEHPKKQ